MALAVLAGTSGTAAWRRAFLSGRDAMKTTTRQMKALPC